MAIKSANLSGFKSRKCFCIPTDSNWNVALVSPFWYNWNVFSSSNGILSKSILIPWFCLISSSAVFKIERVFNPKKSILITPASSITDPSIWVTHKSESLAVATGIISVKSLGAIIIPAACIPVLRMEPSNFSASCNTNALKSVPLYISLNFLMLSMSSAWYPSFSANDFSPSLAVKGACKQRPNSVPGLSGTNFANKLDSDNGKSITRATSLILLFAAIVP